jgi:dolichyl-phosphate-mannose-protein mannosyltransferase
VYLIGNFFIWWSTTALIGLYVAIKGLAVLRWQRGYRDYDNVTFKRFDYEVGMSILGWAFHYFPFFLMARQLFLHHYLPALYFAILALCQMYDFASYRFSGLGLKKYPAIGQAAAVGFLAVAIAVFTIYSPLAYGNAWTKGQCNTAKLFSSWDWDCNNFLDSVCSNRPCWKLQSNVPYLVRSIRRSKYSGGFHRGHTCIRSAASTRAPNCAPS